MRVHLTFEWGLSKPDEQQIKLHNFCELWLLSEDPIQMWLSNDDNTLEDKLSLQQTHLIESRIAKPETPLGVEACTRYYRLKTLRISNIDEAGMPKRLE